MPVTGPAYTGGAAPTSSGGYALSANVGKPAGRFQLLSADMEQTLTEARDVLVFARAISDRICGGGPDKSNPQAIPPAPIGSLLEGYTCGMQDISQAVRGARS